jgi:hypothetical protein
MPKPSKSKQAQSKHQLKPNKTWQQQANTMQNIRKPSGQV